MEPDMKESWTVRTTPEQRAYSHILAPNSFGKFDLWVRTDAFDDQPELLEGLSIKPIKRPDEPVRSVGQAHVRMGSQYAPRVKLEPLGGDVLNTKQLEDVWLREHALATSLRRPMRLGAVSLVCGRSDLRNCRWFSPDRGFTHALWLQEVIVHEVLT
jgi:hypothetical protein